MGSCEEAETRHGLAGARLFLPGEMGRSGLHAAGIGGGWRVSPGGTEAGPAARQPRRGSVEDHWGHAMLSRLWGTLSRDPWHRTLDGLTVRQLPLHDQGPGPAVLCASIAMIA